MLPTAVMGSVEVADVLWLMIAALCVACAAVWWLCLRGSMWPFYSGMPWVLPQPWQRRAGPYCCSASDMAQCDRAERAWVASDSRTGVRFLLLGVAKRPDNFGGQQVVHPVNSARGRSLYAVVIGREPTCSCPDAEHRPQFICKHQFFVRAAVYGMAFARQHPILWQTAYRVPRLGAGLPGTPQQG